MTTRPWMPLYVGDYLADTAHLRAAEHGAYLLLIMHYWRTGRLPDDDAQLGRIARMTPAEWRRTRPVVEPFFQDGWKHKRIEFEFTEAARLSTAGRAGGKASGEARRAKAAQRSSNGIRTTNEQSFNDHGSDPPTNREALHSQSQKKDAAPDGAHDPPNEEADLFRRGKEVLGTQAGGLIAKLRKSKGGSIPLSRAAIEQAATKHNPREYIGRVINGAEQSSENSFRDNPTGGSLI